MIYCTHTSYVLSTVIFDSTDARLSDHVEDMNDKSTTAYTIKKAVIWMGRNIRK